MDIHKLGINGKTAPDVGHLPKINQQVFIYSRPVAGIRAKMEHETTYLQTSKWHVKSIFTCMHLGFKYHTDQRA